MNPIFDKSTPIYPYSATQAAEKGELLEYRASYQANVACKNALESSIRNHYNENHLDSQAILADVSQDFSMDRIRLVLANTIQQKDEDGRISPENKTWAKTIPIAEDNDGFGTSRNIYFAVNQAHPGIIDLFASQFRKELEKAPAEKKPSILEKLQKPLPEPTTSDKDKVPLL